MRDEVVIPSSIGEHAEPGGFPGHNPFAVLGDLQAFDAKFRHLLLRIGIEHRIDRGRQVLFEGVDGRGCGPMISPRGRHPSLLRILLAGYDAHLQIRVRRGQDGQSGPAVDGPDRTIFFVDPRGRGCLEMEGRVRAVTAPPEQPVGQDPVVRFEEERLPLVDHKEPLMGLHSEVPALRLRPGLHLGYVLHAVPLVSESPQPALFRSVGRISVLVSTGRVVEAIGAHPRVRERLGSDLMPRGPALQGGDGEERDAGDLAPAIHHHRIVSSGTHEVLAPPCGGPGPRAAGIRH